jgi:hypothetical protein
MWGVLLGFVIATVFLVGVYLGRAFNTGVNKDEPRPETADEERIGKL